MTVFDLFRRRSSAPVARERLQVLLAYERKNRNQPDLVGVLRDEIMAVLARHVQIDQDNVQVTMDRGETMSTLEIDVQIPLPLACGAAGGHGGVSWRTGRFPRPHGCGEGVRNNRRGACVPARFI